MNLLALPIMGLHILVCYLRGLIFMIRHPLIFTRFMDAYRSMEPDLKMIDATAEYRKLPRAQRRALERAERKGALA